MTTLFSQEDVLEAYVLERENDAAEKAAEKAADEAAKTARETAARMIRKGKISFEEISEFIPSLSLADIKQIASEVVTQA